MLKLAQPSYPEEDDDQALAQAVSGDALAFGCLIRRHQAMVFGLARHFLRDRHAAEDVSQDVFFELFRNLSHLASAAHLKFWLRRVTANRCIDRLRKRTEQQADATQLAPEPVTPAPTRDVLLECRLKHLVGDLPSPARMVVILRYQEDLEPSEIAAVLDMPVNTVKSHLRRSIATLRAKLPTEMLHEV
jgi:RNA polymerase sigma-70 factor (ECF subfamily)